MLNLKFRVDCMLHALDEFRIIEFLLGCACISVLGYACIGGIST